MHSQPFFSEIIVLVSGALHGDWIRAPLTRCLESDAERLSLRVCELRWEGEKVNVMVTGRPPASAEHAMSSLVATTSNWRTVVVLRRPGRCWPRPSLAHSPRGGHGKLPAALICRPAAIVVLSLWTRLYLAGDTHTGYKLLLSSDWCPAAAPAAPRR